jgi:putative oxidoreductase
MRFPIANPLSSFRRTLTTFHIAPALCYLRALHISVECAETPQPLRGMTMQSSSRSLLSATDGFATKSADVLILIARILLAWVFLAVAYGAITNFAGSLGYFTSLKIFAPQLFTWVALLVELLISASLILGLGTRYGAILAFVFVVIATALAHRYWEYPAGPQQIGQYNNFLKNISIMGGALAIFVTGGGRLSLERMLAK